MSSAVPSLPPPVRRDHIFPAFSPFLPSLALSPFLRFSARASRAFIAYRDFHTKLRPIIATAARSAGLRCDSHAHGAPFGCINPFDSRKMAKAFLREVFSNVSVKVEVFRTASVVDANSGIFDLASDFNDRFLEQFYIAVFVN